MLLPLAQLPAPTSPEAAAWLIMTFLGLLGSAATLVALLVGIKKLRAPVEAPVRVGNAPLEVRAASDYATKGELGTLEGRLTAEMHQLHGRISGMRGEMTERIDRLEKAINDELRDQRREAKGEIGGVHERINEVLSAVSELKGRFEA